MIDDKLKAKMDKLADYIRKNESKHASLYSIAHIYYMNDDNCHRIGTTGCHAGMGSGTLADAKIIGCGIPNMNKKDPAAIDFAEWLVSDQSVYYPIMRWLGDKFQVVRDKNNVVVGWVIGTNEINIRAATNFFKSTRTLNEHKANLPFWKKWKMDRGMHPGLTFVLSYYCSVNGAKKSNGHSCLESVWNTRPLDIYKVLHPDHTDWDTTLDKQTLRNSTNYYGENEYIWGVQKGRKGIAMHKIPIVKHQKVITRFWHLYQKKEESSYSDETLEAFYKNAESYV